MDAWVRQRLADGARRPTSGAYSCVCCTGDLGAIDAKYDVAVSTASPQLDFVVVDDTAVAQQCIELLRKQGLGVATFLMLDKQAHLAAQAGQAVQPPEGRMRAASLPSAAPRQARDSHRMAAFAGVARLFDLVRIQDDRLRPAFFFALRNTLVAQDLEQASRIAYGHGGRWARVVTLQVRANRRLSRES